MLALFFEVRPREDGGWDRYLGIAAGLRPLLAEQEGLLFIDRYRSLVHPGTLLSHSLWRDEAALAAWRANGSHSGAQSKGRQDVFDDYRLRVAHVIRTAAPGGPAEAAAPRSTYRDPCSRPARFMVVATAAGEIPLGDVEPVDTFESINREGERLWLFAAADEAAGSNLIDALCGAGATARSCEVERDYGMFDRAEAPQHYPPVARLGPNDDGACAERSL
jgi:heme-degrading monooxygenase HmoA